MEATTFSLGVFMTKKHISEKIVNTFLKNQVIGDFGKRKTDVYSGKI
jgi:hypothetical protein